MPHKDPEIAKAYAKAHYQRVKDVVLGRYHRKKREQGLTSRRYKNGTAKSRAQANKEIHERRKLAVVNVLTNGEGTCRHCGNGNLDILEVDHINEDGHEQRRNDPGQVQICRWLIRNGYPEGFQILCGPCNKAKHWRYMESQCQDTESGFAIPGP